MPFIILCGFPSSGKTSRSLELKEYFGNTRNLRTVIISEHDRGLQRNFLYSGTSFLWVVYVIAIFFYRFVKFRCKLRYADSYIPLCYCATVLPQQCPLIGSILAQYHQCINNRGGGYIPLTSWEDFSELATKRCWWTLCWYKFHKCICLFVCQMPAMLAIHSPVWQARSQPAIPLAARGVKPKKLPTYRMGLGLASPGLGLWSVGMWLGSVWSFD